MSEQATPELREHLRAVLCEWWGQLEAGEDVDQYLEFNVIYNKLVERGIKVSEAALREELIELGRNNDIQAATSPRVSSVAVHGVTNPEFCG